MGTNDLLTITSLAAWYNKGKPVLHQLSLELHPHEVVGLIGLNGAGKSTLLNTLAGVHQDSSEGKRFTDRTFKLARYMVFSEDSSFEYYTFNEYLSHAFSSYGLKPDETVVDELSSHFGFDSYRRVLIRDLSTGNRRKVFLITGFALRRPLLLLDEPVNGLDFQSTEYLYSLINGYRQHGTVLFSSHIVESISLTADRVLVLDSGHITHEFEKDQLDADTIRAALHATQS